MKMHFFTWKGEILIERFLLWFELVVCHNGWNEEEKTTQLTVALEGPAANVLDDLKENWTYERIKAALTAKCDPGGPPHGFTAM